MAFLLSTKAGGQGINLFAANHLVLFDCDWCVCVCRPATDIFAGTLRTTCKQPRAFGERGKSERRKYTAFYCKSTRAADAPLTHDRAGTIEEKIFQRQLMKQTMSRNVIDDDTVSESFSQGKCVGHMHSDSPA